LRAFTSAGNDRLRAFVDLHMPEDCSQAVTLLREATRIDSTLAQAHMALSRTLNQGMWNGWSVTLEADRFEAWHTAARALALDDRDPYAPRKFAPTPAILPSASSFNIARTASAICS